MINRSVPINERDRQPTKCYLIYTTGNIQVCHQNLDLRHHNGESLPFTWVPCLSPSQAQSALTEGTWLRQIPLKRNPATLAKVYTVSPLLYFPKETHGHLIKLLCLGEKEMHRPVKFTGHWLYIDIVVVCHSSIQVKVGAYSGEMIMKFELKFESQWIKGLMNQSYDYFPTFAKCVIEKTYSTTGRIPILTSWLFKQGTLRWKRSNRPLKLSLPITMQTIKCPCTLQGQLQISAHHHKPERCRFGGVYNIPFNCLFGLSRRWMDIGEWLWMITNKIRWLL